MESKSREERGLVRLVAGLAMQGADGRAGLGALLREIEAKYPGEIDRMASALRVERMNETPFPAR